MTVRVRPQDGYELEFVQAAVETAIRLYEWPQDVADALANASNDLQEAVINNWPVTDAIMDRIEAIVNTPSSDMTPEQYARSLLDDGLKKGWVSQEPVVNGPHGEAIMDQRDEPAAVFRPDGLPTIETIEMLSGISVSVPERYDEETWAVTLVVAEPNDLAHRLGLAVTRIRQVGAEVEASFFGTPAKIVELIKEYNAPTSPPEDEADDVGQPSMMDDVVFPSDNRPVRRLEAFLEGMTDSQMEETYGDLLTTILHDVISRGDCE